MVDLDSIVAFLASRLAEPLPGPEAQRRFAPVPVLDGWAPDDRPASAREAAALILLYASDRGPCLPLTVRRTNLPHHPGQVSLPGGAIDEGEAPADAALREADEEIGIAAADIELIGTLSTVWIPPSNFVLRPFVGFTRRPPAFRPAPQEVSAVIEAPVDLLRDPAHTAWGQRTRQADSIDYPYFDVHGTVVWGATAMVLSEFVSLWDPNHAPRPRPERP